MYEMTITSHIRNIRKILIKISKANLRRRCWTQCWSYRICYYRTVDKRTHELPWFRPNNGTDGWLHWWMYGTVIKSGRKYCIRRSLWNICLSHRYICCNSCVWLYRGYFFFKSEETVRKAQVHYKWHSSNLDNEYVL